MSSSTNSAAPEDGLFLGMLPATLFHVVGETQHSDKFMPLWHASLFIPPFVLQHDVCHHNIICELLLQPWSCLCCSIGFRPWSCERQPWERCHRYLAWWQSHMNDQQELEHPMAYFTSSLCMHIWKPSQIHVVIYVYVYLCMSTNTHPQQHIPMQ